MVVLKIKLPTCLSPNERRPKYKTLTHYTNLTDSLSLLNLCGRVFVSADRGPFCEFFGGSLFVGEIGPSRSILREAP